MTLDAPSAVLVPPPHQARSTGEAAELSSSPAVRAEPVTPEVEAVREILCEDLAGLGLRPAIASGAAGGGHGSAAQGAIELRLGTDGVPDHPEGYRLTVAPEGVVLAARRPAGLYYASRTLLQWLRATAEPAGSAGPGGGAGLRVPGLEVTDRPDLALRGYMLDVTRARVPTLPELFRLVDLLGELKLNQLQLYTEHTFAYRGHEEVWRDASPITPDDVRALDAYCRPRGVELVPNQNSFGHFHRWLTRERYRPLAEVPEGIEHPFSDAVEPFSLCPTDPRVLELLGDLYDQLLPCFRSSWLNVGLDETFDLGEGRSADAVAERGKTRVYVDFLQRVHRLVAERGHRMQFWGDVVIEQPEEIARLPEDVLALEWGYEANHPFSGHAEAYAAHGLDFVLCPGTSTWSSLAGRTTNSLINLARASRVALDTGARGVLITEWGDYGHLQPPAVAEAPLAAGASSAWNARSSRSGTGTERTVELGAQADRSAPKSHRAELARRLDLHVFRAGDSSSAAGGLAEAVLRLGDAHRRLGTRDFNGAAVFFLLAFAHQDLGHKRYRGLSEEGLGEAEEEVIAAAEAIRRVRPEALDRSDGELLLAELDWVARGLALGCRIGRARLRAGREAPIGRLPAGERRALAARVGALAEEHAPLWLARSRPGGRTESVARLERTRDLLRG